MEHSSYVPEGSPTLRVVIFVALRRAERRQDPRARAKRRDMRAKNDESRKSDESQLAGRRRARHPARRIGSALAAEHDEPADTMRLSTSSRSRRGARRRDAMTELGSGCSLAIEHRRCLARASGSGRRIQKQGGAEAAGAPRRARSVGPLRAAELLARDGIADRGAERGSNAARGELVALSADGRAARERLTSPTSGGASERWT